MSLFYCSFYLKTLKETQRVANIVAQNVLRVAAKDVEVAGCKIPKGAYCIAQISSMHYDPNVATYFIVLSLLTSKFRYLMNQIHLNQSVFLTQMDNCSEMTRN